MKKPMRSRRAELIHAVQELEPRQLLSYSINPGSAVVMNTSLGEVAIQLYNDGTEPATIANFLSYVTAGTYNGTIFHRVTSNGDSNGDTFGIVQGGGFTVDSSDNVDALPATSLSAPITLEATPAHPNSTGTIAMARTSGLNSATSQFFFNTTDNSTVFDNNSADSSYNPYAAFGNVIRGLGIVDTIDGLSTANSVTASDSESLSPPETSNNGFVTVNTATEEDTMTVNIGPNDSAGDRTVTFHDPTTGASTNISLNGADATLTFTGTGLAASRSNGNLVVTGTNLELQEVSSTDTTAKTNLVFSSPGRNKHIDLGEINITGSINSITGVGVNLTGDIAITGGVNKIDLLASNAAGFISIDTDSVAKAPETFIDIPFLSDISIQSGGGIKELVTRSYAVNDGTTRGLSANGNIEKVLVYGTMEASINSNGNIGKVLAGQTAGNIEASGTIGTIQLAQMQGGVIFSGQAYNAKTLDIKSIKVLGVLNNTRILSAGNIGPIKAVSLGGSAVAAGIDSSGSDSPADGFTYALAAKAYIKSINLKTPKSAKTNSFGDSEIEAYQVDSLHLGRVNTTLGSTFSVMGIQAVNLKSLVATTSQKQSLDLSNVTSQTALNALIAQRGLKLNTTATIGTVATGIFTTTNLTSGDLYSAITLAAALGAPLPAGTVVSVVSGNNTQTAILSAAASATDTSLTVTPFTANADYAAGSTVQGTTTSTSGLTSGDTYTLLNLSSGIASALTAGTVLTVTSSSDNATQSFTLAQAANINATSLTVTAFTADDSYASGSAIATSDGTSVGSLSSGVATNPNTLASGSASTTGLNTGVSYSGIGLGAPLTAAFASGAAITISSGNNSQILTLSAAASAGDSSLSVNNFTPNAGYSAGSTIKGTGFTIDIIPASDLGVPSPTSSS